MAVCYFASTLGLKRPRSEGEDSEEEEWEEEWSQRWSGSSTFPPMSLCDVQLSKLKCVVNPYLTAFFRLFEDDIIQDFLWVDSCAKLADKYLLAMVYVYFRRALLPLNQYNRMNFFVALYLANDMEEDEEDEKYEIFPWALGESWMTRFPVFLAHRDDLWHQMGFRAVVSRRTCEEVISMAPSHEIWQRARLPHHGGALRSYMKPASPQYGRSSPTYCDICAQARQTEDKYLEIAALPPSPSHLLPQMDLLDEIDLTSTGTKGVCLQPLANGTNSTKRSRYTVFVEEHEE